MMRAEKQADKGADLGALIRYVRIRPVRSPRQQRGADQRAVVADDD
jgi:hypothetical protein